jgi:hypothetical protein
MVKMQVVYFQLSVTSSHVSLQVVEQRFKKMLDSGTRWRSPMALSFFYFLTQFYYKTKILDLQRYY